MSNNPLSTILIVDDHPMNRQLMLERLKNNYRILTAESGKEAIDLTNTEFPDLILLDIIMPGMDGYEVCKILKNKKSTQDIPVIFLTSLNEAKDEFRGLKAGGIDYISKPINTHLLQIRIKNHLALRTAQKKLQKYNENLEALVAKRSDELTTAYRRLEKMDLTKDDFLHAISHELRTPLNGVFGVGQLLVKEVEKKDDTNELIKLFHTSSNRLRHTIDSALLFAQLQRDDHTLETKDVNLESVIKKINQSGLAIDESQILSVRIRANDKLLEESLLTLLRATQILTDPDKKIKIDVTDDNPSYATIHIHSYGKTLKQNTIDNFWKLFSYERSSSFLEPLGLQLPIASELITAMNGSVEIYNKSDGGIIFNIQLVKSRES